MSLRKSHIVVDYSPQVMTLDYFLRWISMGTFKFFMAGSGLASFFTFQVIITIFTIFYALFRDFQFRMHIEKKSVQDKNFNLTSYFLQGFSLDKPYDVIGSTISVIIRVLFILTFCYMVASVCVDLESINFSVESTARRNLALIFSGTLLVYGLFVMIISIMCVPDVPEKKELDSIQQAEKEAIKRATLEVKEELANHDYAEISEPQEAKISTKIEQEEEYLVVDQNDIHIVQLEGDIKNLSNRVEAYILESVMFGALTFSGFLTMIAIDPDNLKLDEIHVFGKILIVFLHDLVLFEFKKLAIYDIFNSSPANLILWLMLQTLVCSTFFLLVIASRLKFTQILEEIDNAIRLARTYNDKEEDMYTLYLQYEESEKIRRRLEVLSRKIDQQIVIARELLLEVKPIVNYMSMFRNTGVSGFLIIILTSLFFFDASIAFFFAFLALMVYIYKQIDDWYRKTRLQSILGKERNEKK